MRAFHRRLAALLALIALFAFVSGAGLDALSVIPAAFVLTAALFVQPSPASARVLEPIWRALALILAARAGLVVLAGGGDPVIPMVDLLLLLLCAESMRDRDGSGDARHFALTFALLIAAAAYRPGPLFAPLFAGYVVCATVLLVLGHLARNADRHAHGELRVERAFILRVSALSIGVLLVSAAVFLFFPRVSQGWASRPASPIARSVVGFSDQVSLGSHGARIEPNPEVVLRVEFPDGPPPDVERLHWRGRSYDRFDGVTWRRTGALESPPLELRWPGGTIEQVVFARPISDANVVFGLHPIIGVLPQSRIRTFRLSSGDYSYAGRGEPIYRVRSLRGSPSAAQLRNAPQVYSPDELAYLQIPALTDRIVALADSFRTAHPDPYDMAIAVEIWLQTAFDYTLELPASRREATLDHFLFARRAGHCEYFSTAMAVLLRAAGVPTRNVNGFLGGEWNDFGRFLTVTQNNAHSWVEVFFPGHGWVTFDPTPAAGADEISSAFGTGRAFGRFFDGLGHRWSKWILDYDVGTQLSLLDRFSAPFSESSATGERSPGRWWLLVALVLLPFAVRRALRLLRVTRSAPGHEAARHYIRLRRAYAKAGYASERSTPLAFAAAIQGAPGSAAARGLVDTYVRVRFGCAELRHEDEQRMRRQVEEVRRALRR